ncbi:MAG: EI24 domain-containing protein [Pseudomonadota bacterium]|nr:EI24 domain-containing protein [Pseudomonadota bacterium]
MESLIVSSFRAIGSLFAPGMLGVFIKCVLVTVAALIGFVVFAGAFFTWMGGHMHGETASLLPWVGSIGSAAIAWLLFPGIMPVIASFFDERIAALIESRDYPGSASHEPAFWPELLHDMRFSALTILLNIIVLPLYLFPVLFPFVFYGLNGYLLGREFFVMAAKRHMPVGEAEALRRRHGRSVLIAGILLALLATVPVVNLFAPFWGIAVMVHLYHRLR